MFGKDKSWIFQPSTMARELNKTPKTITRYLTEMQALGLVEKVPKFKWRVTWNADGESALDDPD